MKKRAALLIVILFSISLPSLAVLKERDINTTLSILRVELTRYHADLEKQTDAITVQQNLMRQRIFDVLNRSQQNAIMLYSQRSGNIFDLTYACHEATEQYQNFHSTAAPINDYLAKTDGEVARYDSLINDLGQMMTATLNERAKIDRNVCLTLAINIRRTLSDNRAQMQQYVRYYEYAERQLSHLNDYATKRYADIQATIFNNSGEDFLTILKNLRSNVTQTASDVKEKYRPKRTYSDWDSRIIIGVFFTILFYVIVAVAINYLIIGLLFTRLVKKGKLDFLFRWLVKKKEGRSPAEAFRIKRRYIIMTTTVITFAVLLAVLRMVVRQNFIFMASGLLVEFAWLVGVILISLLIRLDGDQIKSGFRIYSPIITMCFIVICFRIILIPNDLVQLIFPPILIANAIWQWVVIRRYQKDLPRSDMFYTYVSQVVFLACIVASCVGYTLLAVEMVIWWTMQMTCILTLTCFGSMLKGYGSNPTRNYFSAETPVTRAWFFRFVYHVVLPSLAAGSVMLSIYWAADIFNLSDTSWQIFNMRLVNSSKFTFSLMKLIQALVLFFIFSYLNHTLLDTMHYTFWRSEQESAKEDKRKPNPQNVLSRSAIWKNVIQVVVWGVWLLIAMAIFNINNTWIVAISAGLSTGIGFAMKDILENIYYGISLMAGRIKVGDYISIDGTRGTVKSISYTSTMLEALDGSVIAFQNSQLFTKNYKNLTRNHGNELAVIPVGVAYGSNLAQVKEVIANAVKAIEKRDYIRYLNTVIKGFGDNSVDFKVLAWVDSRKQTYAESDIMEAVYNALTAAGIEIPFPQRDIHVVSNTTIPSK